MFTKFIDKFNEFISQLISLEWAMDVLKSIGSIILVIFGCFLAYKIVIFVLSKYISFVKGDMNKKRAQTINNLVRSFMRYVFVIIGVIFSLQFIGLEPTTIFAGAGVVGIVIGFAFQDLLKDIIAGFFIIFERIYNVGDFVEINGVSGTVNNIGIKTTSFIAYTGEIIIINNRDVSRIVNFTTVNYAICINKVTISYRNDINRFITLFKDQVPLLKAKYPVIIDEPLIKGIDTLQSGGYAIEFHTKVKPMSHYQFRRDFNVDLLKFCQDNNFDTTIHIINESNTNTGETEI